MKKMLEMFNSKTIAVAGAVQSIVTAALILPASALAFGVDAPTGFATDMGTLINAVLSFVMLLAALLVLFYLIWGGIEWITSGGDKGKTESARNKITAAVIGIIILAAAFAILQLVLTFLGLGSLERAFEETSTIRGGTLTD
jgi:uncharacterized membrane protein YjgN (DUF898 family)